MLLHNLCGPPRTPVTWRIEPYNTSLHSTIACFGLQESIQAEIGIWLQVATVSPQIIEQHADSLLPKLERYWEQWQWVGAILVSPWLDDYLKYADTPEKPYRKNAKPKVIHATNVLLVLNVLCRARTGVLLPGLPPAIEAAFLRRTLVTTDDRLIKLAGESA